MKEIEQLIKKVEKEGRKVIPYEEVYNALSSEEKARIEARSAYYDALYALREERAKQCLTQDQLSEMTGIPRATISKIESGKRNVRFDTLITLLVALNLKCKFIKA